MVDNSMLQKTSFNNYTWEYAELIFLYNCVLLRYSCLLWIAGFLLVDIFNWHIRDTANFQLCSVIIIYVYY
jgi:hypothetical protein